jgi:hypothetical protein
MLLQPPLLLVTNLMLYRQLCCHYRSYCCSKVPDPDTEGTSSAGDWASKIHPLNKSSVPDLKVQNWYKDCMQVMTEGCCCPSLDCLPRKPVATAKSLCQICCFVAGWALACSIGHVVPSLTYWCC